MTTLGIGALTNRIKEHIVDVPDDMSPGDLVHWMNGYTSCLNKVLDIIKEMYEDENR